MIKRQEIIKRATENILSIIGPENLELFLKMDEQSGKARDLLKPDLTFSAVGGMTYGELGPFGRCMRFNGSTGYLRQDPLTEQPTGNVDYKIDLAVCTKRAQKMVAIASKVGFVRIALKRFGVLNAATLRVVIYTDVAGVPGVAVANGTSDILACSAIGTAGYENWGFNFSTPPSLQKNQQYWVVLEYADTTGVDANNYIFWACGDYSYGQPRASLAGAWASMDTASHVFGIWSDDLALTDDFTIIALAKANHTSATRCIFSSATMAAEGSPAIYYSSGGYVFGRVYENNNYRDAVLFRYPLNQFDVYGITFAKTDSAGKLQLFANGQVVGTATGTAESQHAQLVQPFYVGVMTNHLGSLHYHFQGSIGPIIRTKTKLSPESIGAITGELLALRKYRMAI